MGRTTVSSSRRKHSKKKVSSEGYRKTKSRRNKSKKIRRQQRDDSYSDDDELTTSSSSLDSSSSSEDEYRRSKRARSRSRNEAKGSKKRSRRRYTSEDSSEDSPPVKKRKRSKKSKKIKKKKKRSKRDVYYSSASSDSGSCSTCKDEDDSKGRIGNRTNLSETRSSISPSSSYGSERIEKTMMENNPVRLKSVITVANLENEEEDGSMKHDQLKEEIVYDYDDYPSSKSNDSVELVNHLNSSPDKRSNAVKEVNSGSNLGDRKEKEINVFDNIGSEVEDLESVLRRKALENLSRFRYSLKTKPVVPVDDKTKSDQSDVKKLTHETVSTTPVSQPVTHRSRFTWRRDPSGKDEKAVTYSEPNSSGSQPAELKLHKSTAVVNEALESMDNTNNVDQKSTGAVETPSVKEGSSKEQHNENTDSSQFEKKTMSVMRGGEMVQVSYKVYIPNRAPALARRQLKR